MIFLHGCFYILLIGLSRRTDDDKGNTTCATRVLMRISLWARQGVCMGRVKEIF